MILQKKNNSVEEKAEKWKALKLGRSDISQVIMGQSPPSATYNKDSNGIPFLQGKAEFGEIYPSPIVFCSQPIKVAEPNDILVSVRAPVGDVNIAPFKCCIGRGLASIRPNTQKLYNLYLYYFLKTQKQKFESLSSGSTFKAIKKEAIENFQILIPPLPEQKKIAEILSTADKAIEKVNVSIEKTQRLKKGLMHELLTGRRNSVDGKQERREFKQTEIGRIPKEWEVVRLGEIAESIKRGPFGGTIKKEIFVPKGYKVYEQKNVINNDFRLGNYYIDEKKYNKLKSFAIKYGDILLTGAGTIGKAVVVPENFEPGIINQALIRITLNKNKILISYFYDLLNYQPIRTKVLGSSHGATMKNVSSVKNIKSLLLPLPKLSEQKEIAEILSTVDKRMELLRKKRERLGRVKKGLMDDLLSGRKRVKISRQETEDRGRKTGGGRAETG